MRTTDILYGNTPARGIELDPVIRAYLRTYRLFLGADGMVRSPDWGVLIEQSIKNSLPDLAESSPKLILEPTRQQLAGYDFQNHGQRHAPRKLQKLIMKKGAETQALVTDDLGPYYVSELALTTIEALSGCERGSWFVCGYGDIENNQFLCYVNTEQQAVGYISDYKRVN